MANHCDQGEERKDAIKIILIVLIGKFFGIVKST